MRLRPTVADFGKKVECRAAVVGAGSEPVFGWKSATSLNLNVTFPPQPIENQTVKGHLGHNVTLEAVFLANPMPDKLRSVLHQTLSHLTL